MNKIVGVIIGATILLIAGVYGTYAYYQKEIATLKTQLVNRDGQVEQYEAQIGNLQATNTSLLGRMEDLSIIGKEGAESINKSLENISKQYDYIENLNSKIQSKDSLNLALVMNIKRSLADINDEDVQVEVKGGVVYVSIADKLLYESGSSTITQRAEEVIGKIATVVNDHEELNILVEGHTDDVPMSSGCVEDNWDLSVKRATSVVRVLQNEYFVAPERLTAAGRSEYMPKELNTTHEGRSANRRTEIIITPKLDQFFQLLEATPVAD
ncbi:MAG: OmpA family protein [Bacteroidota bacterium]